MQEESRHTMGPGGYCICPKCGKRVEHRRGTPCQEEKCPECGARMFREGGYHHELLKEKRAKKNKLD